MSPYESEFTPVMERKTLEELRTDLDAWLNEPHATKHVGYAIALEAMRRADLTQWTKQP